MKAKLLPLVGGILIALAGFAHAATLVKEVPIGRVGTATTVSVSTSAWTKVPASSSLQQRDGILVNNPSSNSARFVGIISTATATPGEATTVRPLEFAPGTDFTLVPVINGQNLYLLSIHTSAENAHVQEVGQ